MARMLQLPMNPIVTMVSSYVQRYCTMMSLMFKADKPSRPESTFVCFGPKADKRGYG
jgi:hypothetical protein